MSIARALAIGGSDPSGAGGIQMDLKTFEAAGVWGSTVVTAITAQNTARVAVCEPVDVGLVAAQLDAVLGDLGADAAKTGVLPTAAVVEQVARTVRDHDISRLVVDPVMASTSGSPLITGDAVDALTSELLPLATLVTPNAAEAERLTGIPVTDRESQAEAARALQSLGARAVMVTGGHLVPASGDPRVVWSVVAAGDAPEPWWESHAFVDAGSVRGTGCMLSAWIAAELAKGAPLMLAIERASTAVHAAIARSVRLGRGARVLQVGGSDGEQSEGA